VLKRETVKSVPHAVVGGASVAAVAVHPARSSLPAASYEPAPLAAVTIEPLSGELVVVAPEGEFDIANAHLVGDTVRIALQRGGRQLIIDLRGTKFFDCAALNALIGAVASLRGDPQATVVLAGSQGIVQRFLAVVGVNGLLPVARTRRDAIEALRARADRELQEVAT
jgi:anti-anti-sigma factor